MNISPDAKKLHTINRMFALIAGSNRSIADHVSSAINFSLDGVSPYTIDEYALDRFAQQLINFYQNTENKNLTFAHCDFRQDEFAPLWMREKMLSKLQELSGHPKGIMLVTGIRQLVCPTGRKWTRKRQAQYDDVIQYMDEVAAANSTPRTQLHLLFV